MNEFEKLPGHPDDNIEIPVDKESLRPLVDIVEKLFDGVMPVVEDYSGVADLIGEEYRGQHSASSFNLGARSVLFQGRDDDATDIVLDEMVVEGQTTITVRITKLNTDLSSENNDVEDIERVVIDLDTEGVIMDYEFYKTQRVNDVRKIFKEFPGLLGVDFDLITEVDKEKTKSEFTPELAMRRAQEAYDLRMLEPQLTGDRLGSIVELLQDASLADRKILEGNETELDVNQFTDLR